MKYLLWDGKGVNFPPHVGVVSWLGRPSRRFEPCALGGHGGMIKIIVMRRITAKVGEGGKQEKEKEDEEEEEEEEETTT